MRRLEKRLNSERWKNFIPAEPKGCPAKREAVMHAYLRKDAQLSRVAVTDYPARGALEIITGYRVLEPGNTRGLRSN